jgi:pyruvate, orthophosphate dikinase
VRGCDQAGQGRAWRQAGHRVDVEALQHLTATFKRIYEENTNTAFPHDSQEQLTLAVRAVFDSWMGERVVA